MSNLPVVVSVPVVTIEKFIAELYKAISPVVLYNSNQLTMANWVIENQQKAIRDAIKIFAGEIGAVNEIVERIDAGHQKRQS